MRVQVEGEGEAHVDSRRIRDPFSSQTIPWNMYEVVDLPMCCGARHLPSSRLNLNTNHTVDPSKGSGTLVPSAAPQGWPAWDNCTLGLPEHSASSCAGIVERTCQNKNRSNDLTVYSN